MRGVQGADGGGADAGLGGRDAASRATGLGGDPEVAGVAALELGDQRCAGRQPAGEDVHRGPAERVRLAVDLGAWRVAVQVQRAELQVGYLGDAVTGVGDHGGDGGGAQRGHGVSVDRPLDGEIVQQPLGVARGQVIAAGGRLAVDAPRLAEELSEGVDAVSADPHRVRVGRRVRTAEGVAGAGLALRRVREPGGGALRFQQFPRRQRLLRPGGRGDLLGVPEVLGEEGLTDPAGARGQIAIGEVPEEFVDCVARRSAGVQSWHGQQNSLFHR